VEDARSLAATIRNDQARTTDIELPVFALLQLLLDYDQEETEVYILAGSAEDLLP
jgi:hypothetical protein